MPCHQPGRRARRICRDASRRLRGGRAVGPWRERRQAEHETQSFDGALRDEEPSPLDTRLCRSRRARRRRGPSIVGSGHGTRRSRRREVSAHRRSRGVRGEAERVGEPRPRSGEWPRHARANADAERPDRASGFTRAESCVSVRRAGQVITAHREEVLGAPTDTAVRSAHSGCRGSPLSTLAVEMRHHRCGVTLACDCVVRNELLEIGHLAGGERLVERAEDAVELRRRPNADRRNEAWFLRERPGDA